MKRFLIFPLALSCALLAGCGAQETASAPSITESAAQTLSLSSSGIIRLDNEATAVTGGADFAGGVVTIQSPGNYTLSGELTGQVSVQAEGQVELILAGASITAATPGDSAIYASDKTDLTITLADGAENVLSDGASVPDEDSHAALYAEGSLVISGNGALKVTAGANNGVQSKADLTVAGGDITVISANHAVKSKGALAVTGGTLDIQAGHDGLRAEDSRIATGDITVTGGSITIVTGDGGGSAIDHAGESFGPGASQEAEDDTAGGKGLNADSAITITGGLLDLNTADDGIHTNGDCVIDGGDITICSNDDAIHADDSLVVNNGNINITDCFEGLEAYTIDVNGGNIIIRSVNDGVNANGPEMMFGGPGASGETSDGDDSDETYFRQTGGYIDIVITGNSSNMGDGVDSNGNVYIEDGILIVSAIGTLMENGIDTGGTLTINGGIVVAGGASSMMEGVDEASEQCSATISTGSQPAGTEVTITDEDGQVIYSATMANIFNSLVISHPDMTQGHVYTVTYGEESIILDFTDTNVVNSGFGFGGGTGGPGPMGGMGGGSDEMRGGSGEMTDGGSMP